MTRRLCRALLLAYPRAFREAYGRDLAITVERRLAEARSRSPLLAGPLTLWLFADIVASGLAERFTSRQLRRTRVTTLDSLLADVRLALRHLRRAPLYTLVIAVTLGLGIGANAAIFTVVQAVLLEPLPYHEPDRLVAIWSNNANDGDPRYPVSPANYDAFAQPSETLDGVEAAYSFLLNRRVGDQATQVVVRASGVTPGMLALLGREPLIGRTFEAGEERAVVLSYRFWQRHFAGDRGIVGRTIPIEGVPGGATVVGVMPEDFVFPYRSMLFPSSAPGEEVPDLWEPIPMTSGRMVDAAGQPNPSIHYLMVVGRLAPGATVEQAQAELRAVADRRAADHPDTNRGFGVTLLRLHQQTVGAMRPVLLLLLGGVGVVLLMTCMNVANVLLARASGRGRDADVRAALGASRMRLAQQSIVESLLLAAIGGGVALALVAGGTGALVALAPPELPRVAEASPGAPVFAFTMGLSLLVGLVVGLLPAVAASRASASDSVRQSRRAAGSAAQRTARSALIVSEVALAAILTVGAVLLMRSFISVMNVDPGFEPSRLLTFQVSMPERYQDHDAQVAFYDRLIERLEAIPGAVKAGGTTRIPLGSTSVTTRLQVQGRMVPPPERPEVEMRRAIGDYFGAMGIPIVSGRAFRPEDRAASGGLAVVNEALAARLFPGESAVGHRVTMGAGPNPAWLEIIGVVGNVRHGSLEEAPRPELYISYYQGAPGGPFMALRTQVDPASVVPEVRAAMLELGADPPYGVRTMSDLRSHALGERRFVLLLVGIFCALALMLAAIGVYGVVALLVGERTAEMGVRFALGARPSQVLAMLLGQALRLAVAGTAAGLVAGVLLARLAAALLYGVEPLDPVTLAAVPLMLLAIVLLAAFIPARRAARIDPVTALRTS